MAKEHEGTTMNEALICQESKDSIEPSDRVESYNKNINFLLFV